MSTKGRRASRGRNSELSAHLLKRGKNSELSAHLLKKGTWTAAEDNLLIAYVDRHGYKNWKSVPEIAGLSRYGKSCRLRWTNHLRSDLNKFPITPEEEREIAILHSQIGNKWSIMASKLKGRTDNEIKNYWNTRIKRMQRAGLPLYPPDICQAVQERQQIKEVSPILSGGGCQSYSYDVLPGMFTDLPVVKFNNFKVNNAPIPSFPILYYQPSHYNTPSAKRFKVSDAGPPLFVQHMNNGCGNIDGNFPYSYNHLSQSCPVSFTCANHLSNVNSSSPRPGDLALKSELPSFQYIDPRVAGNREKPLSLPPSLESSNTPVTSFQTLGSDDLLEALLNEAEIMGQQQQPMSTDSIIENPVTDEFFHVEFPQSFSINPTPIEAQVPSTEQQQTNQTFSDFTVDGNTDETALHELESLLMEENECNMMAESISKLFGDFEGIWLCFLVSYAS